MTNSLLVIYAIGFIVCVFISFTFESGELFLLAPLWPVLYVRYAWEKLK
jgi:hypothetical protein